MRWIFILFRFFPYWAFPLSIVVFELGRHFHRKRSSHQWAFFSMAGALGLLTLVWFGFRGDLHSDEWVRALMFQNH